MTTRRPLDSQPSVAPSLAYQATHGDAPVRSPQRRPRLFAIVVAAVMVASVLTAVSASPAAAQTRKQTIHVAPNGSDANPGTLARPKATIQGASLALRNGGVISLRGGTHTFSNGGGWLLRGGSKGNRVVVTSRPGERARVVSTDGNFCVATDQSFITVRRIDCTGAQGMGSFGGSHVTFRNNRIHDLSSPFIQGIMIAGRGTRNFKVIGNDIANVGQTGIAIGEGRVRVTRNVVVRNNRVRRANLSFQDPSITGGWGSGISVIGAVNARIIGNDVRNIFGEGINCPLSDRCRVRNNVVVDTYNALYYADNTTRSVFENNVGWNTGDPAHTRDYGTGPRVAAGVQFANENSWFEGPTNPTRGNVVRNNVLIDVDRGFSFGGYENGAAGMRSTKILNNTIVRANCGVDIFDPGTNAGNEVRNNIVTLASNGFSVFCGGTRGTAFSHNLWSGGSPGAARGPGDVRSAPQFAGDNGNDAGDYRLAPNSPAIDAGIAIAAVAKDHVGRNRPLGGAHDIGAFEH